MKASKRNTRKKLDGKRSKKLKGGKSARLETFANIDEFFAAYDVYYVSAHAKTNLIREPFRIPENAFLLNVAPLGESTGSAIFDRMIYDNLYSKPPSLQFLTDPKSIHEGETRLISREKPVYVPGDYMLDIDFSFQNYVVKKTGGTALIDIGVFKIPNPESEIITRDRERMRREYDLTIAMGAPISVLTKLNNDFDKYFMNLDSNLLKGKGIEYTMKELYDVIQTHPSRDLRKKLYIITYVCRIAASEMPPDVVAAVRQSSNNATKNSAVSVQALLTRIVMERAEHVKEFFTGQIAKDLERVREKPDRERLQRFQTLLKFKICLELLKEAVIENSGKMPPYDFLESVFQTLLQPEIDSLKKEKRLHLFAANDERFISLFPIKGTSFEAWKSSTPASKENWADIMYKKHGW